MTSIRDHAFSGNQLTSIVFLGDRPYLEDIFSTNSDGPSVYYCPDRTGWPGADIQSVTPSIKCESFDNLEGFEYLVENDSIVLLGCSNTCPADLVIPETIDGYTVNAIVEFAFSNKELSSVTIPNSVTSIGDYAFSNNELNSITIPDSIISIGNYTFSDNQLTSITIPYGVTSIGSHAFAYNQLTSVVIPIGVNTIDNEAFRENQLVSVTLPARLVSIGHGAFRNNALTTLTIPPNVISIGNGAFNNNNLTHLTIPASIVTIGANAFNKNKLVNLSFLGQRPVLNVNNSFLGNGDITSISYCAGMPGWPGDNLKKSTTDYITPEVTIINDDSDCDGLPDTFDAFPSNPLEWIDTDGDHLGNNVDTDDDGDGIFDSLDAYPLDPTNQPIQLLDVDGNGAVDALTDTLLITRFVFGFTGEALINSAVAEDATRTSSEDIEAYLEGLIPEL